MIDPILHRTIQFTLLIAAMLVIGTILRLIRR